MLNQLKVKIFNEQSLTITKGKYFYPNILQNKSSQKSETKFIIPGFCYWFNIKKLKRYDLMKLYNFLDNGIKSDLIYQQKNHAVDRVINILLQEE